MLVLSETTIGILEVHESSGVKASLRLSDSVSMAQPVFRRNDVVEVFYRMGRDEGGNYFPVATPSAGTLRPRFGRTDGWMTARIEEDWPPTEHGERPSSTSSRVRIRRRRQTRCWRWARLASRKET